MKKVFVLILSFLILSMFFTACSDIANITLPQDNSSSEVARNDNTIIWTGQGINSLAEDCGEEGYIHWVLNQAKNVTSAELILGGSGSGTSSPVEITKGGVYHFTTPYFDLKTLDAYVTYAGDIKKNTSLIISEYCPGEDTGGILFEEDFTDVTIWSFPSGWTSTIFVSGQSNWNVTLMNNAGGSPPEMFFQWSPIIDGTSRLVSPVIDASAASGLSLDFKHFVDDFNGDYDLLVQVSTDGGSTWNTVWSITPTGNVGPETVTRDLSAYDGQSFQIAWVFEGNSWNINSWYIDDIVFSY